MKLFKVVDKLTSEIYVRESSIAKHFSSYITNDDTLLDVGSGSGKLAQYLIKTRTPHVQIVDVVDHNLTQLTVKLYDGTRLPYDDNAFDVCMLVFVLHHASNPELLLQEVTRVSKKRIMVVEDTPTNTYERLAWEKWDYYLNHGQHSDIAVAHEAWSPRKWRAIFEQSGLSVTHEKQFRTALPVLGMYQHTAFILDKMPAF